MEETQEVKVVQVVIWEGAGWYAPDLEDGQYVQFSRVAGRNSSAMTAFTRARSMGMGAPVKLRRKAEVARIGAIADEVR